MQSQPHILLEARNLFKTFGDFTAVDGVSFNLLSGECVGLLGPNGAGKTSTIRMIYGFSPMTGGSLTVFGLDMRTQWRAIRARIGVCQQENNPDPDLSVMENLEVFSSYFDIPRSEARRRAERLLEFMALGHRSGDKISDLSGGMLRRLILARALINEPSLLILDEPTTGLDPQSRHQIWERLEALKADGLSILITTHYMEEAARLCDRLIIMDHGKILVRGRPAQLIREYVGRDVLEVSDPDDELRDYIRSEGFMHDSLPRRLIIYGRENDRLFERIGARFCRERCTQRMATLEDVFLRLTGRELRE